MSGPLNQHLFNLWPQDEKKKPHSIYKHAPSHEYVHYSEASKCQFALFASYLAKSVFECSLVPSSVLTQRTAACCIWTQRTILKIGEVADVVV